MRHLHWCGANLAAFGDVVGVQASASAVAALVAVATTVQDAAIALRDEALLVPGVQTKASVPAAGGGSTQKAAIVGCLGGIGQVVSDA